jgi:hypothetical protein
MQTDRLPQTMQKWQRRLGLSDWEIEVAYLSCIDINQAQGRVTTNSNAQTAQIRLMSPDDRQKNDPNDRDIELDLVHELIHVRLWAVAPTGAERSELEAKCLEQAIDWMARAMLSAERANLPKK